LIKANPDKINWEQLSFNPNAIHLLEANLDKVNWNHACRVPGLIQLIEANQDKIDWNTLSRNSAAIHLLKDKQDKIGRFTFTQNEQMFVSDIEVDFQRYTQYQWECISSNPSIFTYDYDAMKDNKANLHKELIDYLWHPTRVGKWMHEYGTEDGYLGWD
jgi:hypothetical protein